MSSLQEVRAYWQLFRLLTMPARYQYWLLIIGIGFAALGALGGVFGYWWLWIPAPALFGVWLFTAGLIIHGQLLSVASNRSFNLLPGVRQRALVIHLAVLSLVSGLLALLQLIKGEPLVASLIGSWAICSLLSFGFIASLVLSPQYGLLLLWLFGWVFYKWVWPLGMPLWLYLCVAVIAWWLYARWWLQWLPEKRIANPFMAATWGAMQLSKQNLFAGRGAFVGIGRRLLRLAPLREVSSKEVYINLLLGGAGSLLERLVNWLVIPAVLALVWLLCFVFDITGVVKDLAEVAVAISFWAFLSGAGLGFIMWMYHNLGRAWLYFQGNRVALFKAIERRYLQNLLLDSVVFCSLSAIALWWLYPDLSLGFSHLLWSSLYFVLVLGFWWFYFQCAWLVYCWTHGSVQWWSFAVFLGVIGQLMSAGFCWWLVAQRGQALEALVLIFACGFLLLGSVLRPFARVASARMNFARRPH